MLVKHLPAMSHVRCCSILHRSALQCLVVCVCARRRDRHRLTTTPVALPQARAGLLFSQLLRSWFASLSLVCAALSVDIGRFNFDIALCFDIGGDIGDGTALSRHDIRLRWCSDVGQLCLDIVQRFVRHWTAGGESRARGAFFVRLMHFSCVGGGRSRHVQRF